MRTPSKNAKLYERGKTHVYQSWLNSVLNVIESNWLKMWRESSGPITERRWPKPKQSWITFNAKLNTAQLLHPHEIISDCTVNWGFAGVLSSFESLFSWSCCAFLSASFSFFSIFFLCFSSSTDAAFSSFFLSFSSAICLAFSSLYWYQYNRIHLWMLFTKTFKCCFSSVLYSIKW